MVRPGNGLVHPSDDDSGHSEALQTSSALTRRRRRDRLERAFVTAARRGLIGGGVEAGVGRPFLRRLLPAIQYVVASPPSDQEEQR